MADYDLLDAAAETAADRRDTDQWFSHLLWHMDATVWDLSLDQRSAYLNRMATYTDGRLQAARDRAEQRRVVRCWWGFIALAILGAAIVAGVVGS